MEIYSKQAQLNALRLRLRYFQSLNLKAEIESLRRALERLEAR